MPTYSRAWNIEAQDGEDLRRFIVTADDEAHALSRFAELHTECEVISATEMHPKGTSLLKLQQPTVIEWMDPGKAKRLYTVPGPLEK